MSNAQTENRNIKLGVVAAPHMHWGKTIPSVMREICIALIPAVIMSVYNFGVASLTIMGLAVITAVATEAACLKIMKKDVNVDDLHAVYLGLLIAFMLPANSPWWLPVIGAFVCITLGKMVFGGLGANPFCPPALAWAVLMVCWPILIDASSIDLTTPFLDPLYRLKYYGVADVEANFSYASLLLGQQMGGFGSSQVGALLIGGIFIASRLDVSPEIPIGFFLGIFILSGILSYSNPEAHIGPMYHILSGSTVFGAFFLATEFGGSPSRPVARLLYGMLAGVLVIVIRSYGIYSDGVPFAVLLANLIAPYLELIRPKPFGAQ
ncbi:RnfABCDGE type electron transport complex subunit D [Desulfovibrio sp. OttesenSCG-928-C14]|nr:RnfABCDGE type electron transport complex subunit D [Desulfovibrio sp. OttesenSCG-928-C14]